jgi:hypothetical protein
MNPDEANPLFLAIDLDFHKALRCQREFVLRDLVSLGKVRVEIVFSGELAVRCNPTMGGQSGPYRILNHFPVKDRETPREPGTHRAGVGVRLCSEEGGTPAKNFAPRQKLGMNLKAHYRFIFHIALLVGMHKTIKKKKSKGKGQKSKGKGEKNTRLLLADF